MWLSFLVPVNSEPLGLSKDQLVNKRVVPKHFDKYQLDDKGNRLKGGYPCLLSTEEVEHEVPLTGDHLYDHNYCKKEDIAEIVENPVVAQEHPVDHIYSRLATNPSASSFLNAGNNF
ncbi:unnamed protein product [Parnassius apollo]|uniref:(apollo) hypothetical protein n=1 Tax=Parnassius apollo TaxID=110799 RepID=A0A8S3XM96_PARAO|nr:unnamed protein product [Parnassius apollo]